MLWRFAEAKQRWHQAPHRRSSWWPANTVVSSVWWHLVKDLFCVTRLVDVPSGTWTTMTLDLWGATKCTRNLAICTTRSNAMKHSKTILRHGSTLTCKLLVDAIIQICRFIDVQRKFLNPPRNLPRNPPRNPPWTCPEFTPKPLSDR